MTERRPYQRGTWGSRLAASGDGRRVQPPSAPVVPFLALLACVDARVVADCAISTTGVAFGNDDPLVTTNADATGNLTVVCTHISGGATRVTYTAALSAGGSGNYAQRRMRAGTATLNYNLFDSAARTRIWGNGTGGMPEQWRVRCSSIRAPTVSCRPRTRSTGAFRRCRPSPPATTATPSSSR